MADVSATILIKNYFGLTSGETIAECKRLTPEDKLELAEMIAKETGDTVKK